MRKVMLSRSHRPTSIVGLDVDAGSVAAVEVRSNGSVGVTRSGIAPLGQGAMRDGEVTDADAVADALRELFSRQKLSKSVRVGIANQRIAMRTLSLPMIEDPEELGTAVRFQAQEHIPMPIEQAVIDYQVVGGHDEEGVRTMDVVVVAARRDMVGRLMDAVRGAGLKPVGMDLSAFGLIRALADNSAPTTAYCNLGDVTNLAVARGGTCLFTRIVPVGHEEDVSKLADELRLSLEFYAAQDGAPPIERAVLSGAGSTTPGLPEQLTEKLGHPFIVARPAALGHLEDAEAARLTLSYGLALEQLASTSAAAPEAGEEG